MRRGRRVERQFGQDAGVDVADGAIALHRAPVTAPYGALRRPRRHLTVDALVHRVDGIGAGIRHVVGNVAVGFVVVVVVDGRRLGRLTEFGGEHVFDVVVGFTG